MKNGCGCGPRGTGEYFAANGMGEYFAANGMGGLGEYFDAMGADAAAPTLPSEDPGERTRKLMIVAGAFAIVGLATWAIFRMEAFETA